MSDDRRFRDVQRYAGIHGFLAGFPNFHQADHGSGVVHGTVLLRDAHAEWRDVPRSEYQVFHIGDVPGLFRGANDYAGRQGYEAAFPNCEQADHGAGVVYGTILMKPGTTEWRDVRRSELGGVDLGNVPAMMRAVNDYAGRQGFPAAFPTFHQADHGQGVVYGVVLLRPGVPAWRDVSADFLARYSAPRPRWAILLCNLNDRPPPAGARDRYVDYFTDAGEGSGGAYDYWRDMSYGTEAPAADVLGFFTIPRSTAELLAFTGSTQRGKAFEWGLDAARQGGVRLQDYDHTMVILNGGGNDHGKTSGGVTLVFADTGELEPTFIFHEMGHELGMDHSFGEQAAPCATGDGRPGAYCDRADIMSAMAVDGFQDARNRLNGPSLCAISRNRLGWMDRARIRSLPIGLDGETITLAALDRPEVDGHQMAVFSAASRVGPPLFSTYTVEFRERAGWDRGLPASAVIVHEIRPDGLVRRLTGTPVGTLRAGGELVSPAPSTVVRVEAIDAAAHVARLRVWSVGSGARIVRILTIRHDPPGPEPQGEFVLIRNDRAAAADLGGWTLSDLVAHTFTFPPLSLPPGHIVRVWTGTGTADAENLYWGRRQAVWNNTGDVGVLRDAGGAEVSRFAYNRS